MMNKIQLFTIICLFNVISNLYAQNNEDCVYTLSGKILDEHDNEPLQFATIYLKEIEKGATTDSNGYYIIKDLCKGRYSLQCNHLGCEPIEARITINGNTKRNFFPEHHLHELEQLEITEQRTDLIATQSSHNLSEQSLNETMGQTLGESLKKIPGVNSLNTGNSISKPVIHGLHSNRLVILNNDVRQESQQWGSEHAPEIDPFIAQKITVIKGANTVRYGSDAIGGIILLEPKPLRIHPGIAGNINLLGFSNGQQGVASAFMEGNHEKIKFLSWQLQSSVKRGGNIQTPEYFLGNTGVKELNYSGTLGYNRDNYGVTAFYSKFNTDVGIYEGSHVDSLSDLIKVFEQGKPQETYSFSYIIQGPYQHIEHDLLKLKSFYKTQSLGKFEFTYALQRDLRQEYDEEPEPETQFDNTTHSTEILWKHNKFKQIRGLLGFNGTSTQNFYQGDFFVPGYSNYTGGIFGIEHWKRKNLEVEIGLRYGYRYMNVLPAIDTTFNSIYKYNKLTGNLGIKYQFSEHLKLKSNFGNSWRAPAVNELFINGVHHGAASIEIGDPNLQQERSYKFITTLNYKKKNFDGYINVHHNYIQDFIYLKSSKLSESENNGAFPVFNYVQDNVRISGIDVAISYEVSPKFEVNSNSTLLESYNISRSEYLSMMPANRFENSLKYLFKLKNVIEDGYISISIINVLKQSKLPDNGEFVPAPDGYTLLNAYLNFTLPVNGQNISIGIGGNNILNTIYRDYMNRFRYYAHEMGRNISLRISIPLGKPETHEHH